MCARDAHQERHRCKAAACSHQKMAAQPPLPLATVTEFGGARQPAHLITFPAFAAKVQLIDKEAQVTSTVLSSAAHYADG